MKYSDNEKCTILLTTYVGLSDFSGVKPLSLKEWNQFVEKLIENGQQPEIVFGNSAESDLKNMGCTPAFAERVGRLADRDAAAALELDAYEKRGIYAVTMLNKEYPVMLRRVLKQKKPPVLFYAGELSLAKKIGIGAVGSRNVSREGIDFTRTLAERAAAENLVVYSGGARGVDSVSEMVSLEMGGGVVSYIAESLYTKIRKNTNSIADGRILLFSDVKPDAGFSAGRAMNRNKYIYASAYGTFIAESDYGKGGTWNGAMESLKYGWGNVFVYDRKDCAGNQKLIEAGGIPYTIDERRLCDVLETQAKAAKKPDPAPDAETTGFRQMTLNDLLN